jgi:hypothetical protein
MMRDPISCAISALFVELFLPAICLPLYLTVPLLLVVEFSDNIIDQFAFLQLSSGIDLPDPVLNIFAPSTFVVTSILPSHLSVALAQVFLEITLVNSAVIPFIYPITFLLPGPVLPFVCITCLAVPNSVAIT